MSTFVTCEELAALIGCQTTSRACMCRWLIRNKWPFERDRNGFPKILRSYYEQRMMGDMPAKLEIGSSEPNYACFGVAS